MASVIRGASDFPSNSMMALFSAGQDFATDSGVDVKSFAHLSTSDADGKMGQYAFRHAAAMSGSCASRGTFAASFMALRHRGSA
jgi:hypothetical protein